MQSGRFALHTHNGTSSAVTGQMEYLGPETGRFRDVVMAPVKFSSLASVFSMKGETRPSAESKEGGQSAGMNGQETEQDCQQHLG